LKKKKNNLLDLLKVYVNNPPVVRREASDCNYPSSLSIKYVNSYGETEIVGGCNRANAYRRRGDTPTDRSGFSNQLVMKAGKKVEETIINYVQKMGIWRGSNIRFFDRMYNVSGEIDLFVEVNGKLILVELKTIYGMYADKDILGVEWRKKTKDGYPKVPHLIQVAPYLEKYRDITDELHLIYFNRGNFLFPAEFIITLDKTGIICVNGKQSIVTLRGIRERILELEDYIEQEKLPPRDYALKYSEEKAKALIESGRKKKYWLGNWKRNKGIVGDWNCTYCNFKSKCWSEK